MNIENRVAALIKTMASICPSSSAKIRNQLVHLSLFPFLYIDLTLSYIHDEVSFLLGIIHNKHKFIEFTSCETHVVNRVRQSLIESMVNPADNSMS